MKIAFLASLLGSVFASTVYLGNCAISSVFRSLARCKLFGTFTSVLLRPTSSRLFAKKRILSLMKNPGFLG